MPTLFIGDNLLNGVNVPGVAELDNYGKAIQPQQWQSNPNLLHNWYFGNPVNQRGQTEYSGGGYTIDRWRLSGDDDVLYVRDNFIETTGITQVIEHGEVYLGIPITLSILYEESDGAIDMVDNTYVISAAGESFSYWPSSSSDRATPTYILGSNTKGEIRLSIYKITNGDSLKIHSVKLELGTQQTHAHQDADGNWVLNEIPDYGEQLALCQRYFFRMGNTDTSDYMPVAYGVARSTDSILVAVPLPVIMRTYPSVISSGVYYSSTRPNLSVEAAAVTGYYYIGNARSLSVNGSGLTEGATYGVYVKQGYIDFIADL